MRRLLPLIIITYLTLYSITGSAQVTDIDGNVYQTVTIGTQVWMKENLKTTKYNDGTSIPNITDNVGWGNLTTPAYCWYNNDETANKNIYGALYNWYSVNTGKLCPSGWHVPSDSEIKTLEMYLGLTQAEADAVQVYRGTDQGNKLKEAGNTHWSSPSAGTNLSGFSALPSAYRDVYGGSGGFFYNLTNVFCLWSSTEYNTSWAWYHYLINTESGVGRDSYYKKNGYSVRCLKENLSSQPSITSYSPTSGPSGTSVTITGANFSTTLTDNIVWFGTAKATVTAATSTLLTVTVPTGSTYKPISVTVNGFTAYSAKPFNVTFNSEQVINATSFASKTDFATGSSPIYLAVADFDNDGKPDIATSNQYSNSISVFRNTCTAGAINSTSFSTKVDFTAGTEPIGIAVGDLDGDGKPDIAVANISSNSVSVFRNKSTSGSITATSFSTKVDFTTATRPSGIAIGDIDKDGKPDIITANAESNNLSVLRNTSSTGTIDATSFATKIDFSTGSNAQNVILTDVDGDGKPEAISANYSSNSISVHRNTSTAGIIDNSSFASKVDFATGTGPYNLAAADLDGDGKSDIAVTNYNVNTISIFRNTSTSGSITSASFAAKSDYTVERSEGITIGDLDGDGKADIVATNYNGGMVSVLKNNSTSGSLNFASKIDYSTGTMPQGVEICDFDGDGKPDVVVTNSSSTVNTISVFRNIMAAAIPPSAPVVGTITQPTCTVLTGSVVLSGLPATGTWTLTRSPGSVNTQGTGISTTVSGLAPGTYTFTVTNAGGGISEPTSDIVINVPAETPSTPIEGTKVQPTCKIPTGSVDISGLPSSGTWTLNINPGGPSTGTGTHAPVSGLTPGTYSFTVTNAAGCTSAPLTNVIIEPVPVGNIPVIELKWSSVLICYNLNNVFTSWQWYRDNNPLAVTDKAYYNTNKAGGIYKVLSTDKDECKNYSNTIQVNPGSKGISAYPNPADANFTLSMTDESRGKARIEIYNTSGIKVMELQTDKSEDNLQKEFPVNNLDQGIYTIKVTVNQKDVSFTRLVVTR